MESVPENDDYKALHEKFISNGTGTDSPVEILGISTIPILAVVLNGLLVLTVNQIPQTENWIGGNSKSFLLSFYLLDFVVSSLPLLLSLTSMSDNWMYIVFLLCILVILCTAITKYNKKIVPKGIWPKSKPAKKSSKANKRIPKSEPLGADQAKTQVFDQMATTTGKLIDYITNYRSSMLLVTAMCILAVDFPVFPRRFGKTENFGFGLMDIGVGSFVFANGVVSTESRKGNDEICANKLKYLRKAFSDALPLVVLGFLRLASVKASGYHEHVTEYGLHWNFFFTLASTKILSSLVFLLSFPLNWSWSVAIILAACHETSLSLGLSEWIIEQGNTNRTNEDLISANREGIVSVCGYLALHISGVAWGHDIFSKPKTAIGHYKQDAVKLMQWVFLMWASLYSSINLQVFLPPSRRLANWTYFNWMIAYNLTLMLLFLLCDLLLNYLVYMKQNRNSLNGITYTKDTPVNEDAGSFSGTRNSTSRKRTKHMPGHVEEALSTSQSVQQTEQPIPNITLNSQRNTDYGAFLHVPVLYSAINRNPLTYFLFANLLTGLINIMLPTINITGCPAVLIICGYVAILHLIIVVIYRADIKII